MHEKKLKRKIKEWYEQNKRGIKNAAYYTFGVCVGFGGLYLAAVLHENRYDDHNVTTSLTEKNGEYGILYSREFKNGKPDYDTTQFLSWPKDDAKKVAERLLELVSKDDVKES